VLEVGGVIARGARFYDTSVPPVLTAASSVVATLTLPDATSATPTITNPSTGIYAYNYISPQAGHYGERITGVVGGLTVVYTDSFNVQEQAAALIVSLDEARDHLNFPSTETANDEELRFFIEAATRVIEGRVGNVIRRTVTNTIYPGLDVAQLAYGPVISLTSGALIRDGSAVDITNFYADGYVLKSKTGTFWPAEPWTLVYVAGRPIIPANIRDATLEAIRDLWSSQRGASIRQGDLSRLPFVISFQGENAIHPDLSFRSFG
jgi:hypothetical protein